MEKTGQAEVSDEGDWGFWHYLPYSKEDEQLGMVCTTVGSQDIPPNTVYPPYRNRYPVLFRPVTEGRILPEYQIVYVPKGEGVFSAAGKTWKVVPGSMFFILPGLKHWYKPVNVTCRRK
jgi:hypothetical protein